MKNFLLASNVGGISFVVVFALLTVAVFALTVWLVCLGLKGESLKIKIKPKYIFVIVLVLGAAIRMAITFTLRGLVGNSLSSVLSVDRIGYTGTVNLVNTLLNDGFKGFWTSYDTVYYYPLTMYIISFFGAINTLFAPLSISSTGTLILIKLPFVISDILLAFAVYKVANKYAGEVVALALGGFVALCPIFMLGSIWPSAFTFFALALVVLAYLMLERKYILLVVTYTISLLICFEATFLFPIIAVFLIYAYVKKVVAYKKEKVKEPLWNSEYGLIIKLPVAIAVCIVCSYLICLPFAIGSVGANPFVILYTLYLKPLGFKGYGYFTFNGLSLYTIFDKNGASMNLTFPPYVFSILFGVAIVAVTLIIYLSKKNRANLVMFASYMLLTINMYFVNSSELTLLPFLAITLIAFLIIKDRRIMQILGVISLFAFLNAAGVLLKADYFGINANYGTELLDGTWMVLSIISSAVALLCHIYYTFVLLDVVMNGRVRKLSATGETFGSALKGLIKIKD